jgi:hypothetical protein
MGRAFLVHGIHCAPRLLNETCVTNAVDMNYEFKRLEDLKLSTHRLIRGGANAFLLSSPFQTSITCCRKLFQSVLLQTGLKLQDEFCLAILRLVLKAILAAV